MKLHVLLFSLFMLLAHTITNTQYNLQDIKRHDMSELKELQRELFILSANFKLLKNFTNTKSYFKNLAN